MEEKDTKQPLKLNTFIEEKQLIKTKQEKPIPKARNKI